MKDKSFPLKIENKTRVPTCIIHHHAVGYIQNTEARVENEKPTDYRWKNKKKSLFAEGMIV